MSDLDLTEDERDPHEDAQARAWSRLARQRAEAGLARDDSEFLDRKRADERRRLAARGVENRV